MDKRKVPRYKKRIPIQFWSVDDKNPRKGFTQNISVIGMFVATNAPFRPRNRVFLEIPSGQEKLVLQAEVRYSARVDLALRSVIPSGMGVRLLRVDEVMSELLKLKEAGVEVIERSPMTEAVAAAEPPKLKGPVFPITYDTPHDLATSYERDVKFGGLFIAAAVPADQDEEVIIEFRFAWDPAQIVQVQALVVKRFAAAEGSVLGESVSGMGLAFANPADVMSEFKKVFSALQQTRTQEEEGV